MTRPVLLQRAVHERRRWLVGWSIGILALVATTVGFWPALEGRTAELDEVIAELPESLRSLFGLGGGVDPFSPIGYLSSQIYAFMLPLLLLVAGLGLAGGVAGDEERGLLETVYALPISRRRVVLERWGAVMVLTALLAALTFLAVWVTTLAVGLGVGAGALAAGSLAAVMLTWCGASLVLAVGAWTGRRGLALGVGSAVLVAGYVVTSLADAGIAWFESVTPMSPFTHYDIVDTLQAGRPTARVVILAVVTVTAVALALRGIDRRDLRAG